MLPRAESFPGDVLLECDGCHSSSAELLEAWRLSSAGFGRGRSHLQTELEGFGKL